MNQGRKGSRVFMMELMFSILYFIIIAAVCVQCFATSFAMSKESKELTRAVNLAGNAAECFYGDRNFGNFTEYYNEEWDAVDSADEAFYRITGIENTSTGNYSILRNMSITVTRTKDDSEVYAVTLTKGFGLED